MSDKLEILIDNLMDNTKTMIKSFLKIKETVSELKDYKSKKDQKKTKKKSEVIKTKKEDKK